MKNILFHQKLQILRIVYAPTESLYKELTEYQDPSTKELLIQELMKKYKIVIMWSKYSFSLLTIFTYGFSVAKSSKRRHRNL